MNGSEKQIKWANEVRDSKMEAFARLENAVTNEIARKAVTYIRDNDNASFWIDYREVSPKDMFYSLFKGSLCINGYSGEQLASLDTQTGAITESHKNLLTGEIKHIRTI